MSVMTETAPDFHLLILDGMRMQAQGRQARRDLARALKARGMTPPRIAAEMARRALEGGCRPEDLARLGITEHSVRLMLKEDDEA